MSDGLDSNRFPVSIDGRAMSYDVAGIAEHIRQRGPMVLSSGGSDEEHLRYVWVADYANLETGQIKGMGPSAPPYVGTPGGDHYGMVRYVGPDVTTTPAPPPPPPPPPTPPPPPPQPNNPGVLAEWEVEGLRKWWPSVEERFSNLNQRLATLEKRGQSAGP